MKNLLLFAVLLVISTGAIASPRTETGLIDPQQQYTEVAYAAGKVTAYIALSGKGIPIEVSSGMVSYQELDVSDDDIYTLTGGPKTELLSLVDCNKQVFKEIVVAFQDSEFTITYVYSGEALKIQGETAVDLAKESWHAIDPNTVASLVSDAVCNYVKNHKS